MSIDRNEIAGLLISRLESGEIRFREAWNLASPVRHLICDELLPEVLVREAFERFPETSALEWTDDMRERKFAGADTSRFHPLINEILFAFQDPRLLKIIQEITEFIDIEGDPSLYASGLSIMAPDGFLNPHIDNSHDRNNGRFRILNALYYVSPGWEAADGGSLELWEKPGRGRVDIPALFNRLVLMQTDRGSWHSVGRVTGRGRRNCISNYYFSAHSPIGKPYRHVTTFKARPDQKGKAVLFDLDAFARNALGRVLSNRTLEGPAKSLRNKRPKP